MQPLWLSFLDKTNLIVASLTACCIAYTRSVGMAYFGAGGVLCTLSVKGVKKMLRQPRPAHLNPSHRKSTYGMPSTHSATIAYYAAYSLLACLHLPIHTSLPQNILTRVIPPLVIIPWAILIVMSRVWLGHHTWPQVAVGCSYGLLFACVWIVPWTYGLAEYGNVLEQLLDPQLGRRYL